MKYFKEVIYKVYTAWVVFVFSIFLVILFPMMVFPVMIHQKLGFINFRFIALWAYIFSQLTFIRYKIYGKEYINKGQSYIYCCNHTSYLDSPGIALTISGDWRPLGKKELIKIPVFGFMLKKIAVIVDRSNPRSRKESVDRMKKIVEMGSSIVIFPEGTMNRTDKILQPFYDGAFKLAIESKQPVIPMVIVNAGKLLPPNKFLIKPGTIKVYVGEPIPSKDLTMKELPILKNQTYEKMMELMKAGS